MEHNDQNDIPHEEDVMETIQVDESGNEMSEPEPTSNDLPPTDFEERNEVVKDFDREVVGGNEPLIGPNATYDEVDAITRKQGLLFADLSDEEIERLSPEARRTREAILASPAMSFLFESFYEGIKTREDAKWRQGVEYDGRVYNAARAVAGGKSDVSLRIRDRLGKGQRFTLPLWNSGFWVTVKSPTAKSWMMLLEQISTTKLAFAISTTGASLSASDVYKRGPIVEFILEHIVASTTPFVGVDDLKAAILITDYLPLLQHMAYIMFPRGYAYLSLCVANPEKCDHSFELMLALERCIWTDNSNMTDYQLLHMSKRTGTRTVEEIERYRDEFPAKVPSSVELMDGVFVKFRIPSLTDVENASYRWAESINSFTTAAFGVRLEGSARANFQRRISMTNAVRAYIHFIDSISIIDEDGSEEVVTDYEKIDEILDDISDDVELISKLNKHRLKYLTSQMRTIVGIPKHNCPKCGKPPAADTIAHKELIAIDPSHVFLHLLDQNVENIQLKTSTLVVT